MKIILVGYMGVGKTSIAKKIAKKVGISAFDLDEMIENDHKSGITSIFLEKGEVYFRKIETAILKKFMDTEKNFVISLGGGTPCYANNYEFLQEKDVVSIYLKASVQTLVQRLENKRTNRPLIQNLSVSELENYITKHIFDRSYYYHQAKYIINTDGKKKSEIVDEVLQILV